MLLRAHFRGENPEIEKYRKKFYSNFLQENENDEISKLPTFYRVPRSEINNAKRGRKVEEMEPVFLQNFQWIHAVSLITQLVDQNLLRLVDLDPLQLYEKSKNILVSPTRTVQVAL